MVKHKVALRLGRSLKLLKLSRTREVLNVFTFGHFHGWILVNYIIIRNTSGTLCAGQRITGIEESSEGVKQASCVQLGNAFSHFPS